MKSCIKSRRRTPIELAAGLGRYLLYRYRGDAAVYPAARRIAANLYRPLEVLQAEQDHAVERIVNYAYKNSPYYRRKYDAVGFKPGDVTGLQQLSRLPEISKIELAENVDDILCAPKESLMSAATGGTTGIQLTFYRDRLCTTIRRGIDLAIPRYYGWRDGQWQGWLWGASQDLLFPRSLKGKLIQRFGERRYYFDASLLTDESYEHFVRLTKEVRPSWVSAYPSLAYDLAERIAAGSVSPARVPVLSLTAEPTNDTQRDSMLRHLADEVFERYGSRECGIAAIECPEHNGMHLFMESVAYEAIDRGPGLPAKDLVVTDLLNTAMPLIRYHTGDLGEIEYDECRCGRSTPRLKNILGRETETIWRTDGTGIAGPIVAAYLISQVAIHRPVQIIQSEPTKIILRVQAAAGEYASEIADLIALFRREIDPKIEYRVDYVDRIERAASGKYRYVISHVKQGQQADSRDTGGK